MKTLYQLLLDRWNQNCDTVLVTIVEGNGNYALDAGYGIDDALAVEADDSLAAETYVNVIAVKEGNENSAKTKALVDAVLSDKVKEYIRTCGKHNKMSMEERAKGQAKYKGKRFQDIPADELEEAIGYFV